MQYSSSNYEMRAGNWKKTFDWKLYKKNVITWNSTSVIGSLNHAAGRREAARQHKN